jgi:hypothetical protein
LEASGRFPKPTGVRAHSQPFPRRGRRGCGKGTPGIAAAPASFVAAYGILVHGAGFLCCTRGQNNSGSPASFRRRLPEKKAKKTANVEIKSWGLAIESEPKIPAEKSKYHYARFSNNFRTRSWRCSFVGRWGINGNCKRLGWSTK